MTKLRSLEIGYYSNAFDILQNLGIRKSQNANALITECIKGRHFQNFVISNSIVNKFETFE